MTAAAKISERQFQDTIVDLAAFYGWKVHHVRPGMTGSGSWLTNVQGHAGFPDLVLAHAGRERGRRGPILPAVIFAELKTSTGMLRHNQIEWQQTLTVIPGIEYYVWRPEHLEAINDRLDGKPWPN
jgi:hypothetical protein